LKSSSEIFYRQKYTDNFKTQENIKSFQPKRAEIQLPKMETEKKYFPKIKGKSHFQQFQQPLQQLLF